MSDSESRKPEPRRWDIGRVIDYMFGRNTLIGIASLMLLVISGYATWSGMNDFIVGVSTSPANQGREIPGGLTVSNTFLVIAIVVALTFLMWLALRESFAVGRRFTDRLVTLPLYIFLALWSVGFGYGFWWSLIAGEEATRTSLSGLQEDARDAGAAVAARLDAVRIQIDSVVSWSETQMAREETSGGSCGVTSGSGRGPLYNARRSVRDAIASLREGISQSWIGPVQVDLDQLRLSAARLQGETVAERQLSFEGMASDIRGRARNIAARSNEIGKSTATEMNALADSVSVAPGEPGFSCYDPTLAQRLRQAADQAVEPANLVLREANFNEGPAGVANAVKNLWSNIGDKISYAFRFVASGGNPKPAPGDNAPPISGRDLIALLATLGIDLGLFALTVLNPPPRQSPRPSGEVIRQIRDAIDTAVANTPDVTYEWIHRHLIHHHEKSYLVIPNLYSAESEERDKAIAMNQIVGVLADLGIVRWPDRGLPEVSGWFGGELGKLKREEKKQSRTDLAFARKAHGDWLKKQGYEISDEEQKKVSMKPMRNHGLFSKAATMLEQAKWGERARNDIEIFVLIDTDGLTPLLMVLNEGSKSRTTAVDGTAGKDARNGVT